MLPTLPLFSSWRTLLITFISTVLVSGFVLATSAHAAGADDFVTTWTVGSGETVTIPHQDYGAYSYDVDWGDGSPLTIATTTEATHTYSTAGTYEIRISGTFPGIKVYGTPAATQIQSVEQWGTIVWESFNSAFMEAPNLTVNATDTPDLSVTVGFVNAFRETSANFDMTSWVFSSSGGVNVTQMLALTPYNQPIDTLDVTNISRPFGMFSVATDFNQPVNNWNTSNFITTGNLFRRTAFNHPLDNWDMSKVSNMSGMFAYNTVFNQPIAMWNTASVTDMSYMFDSATAFDQPLAGLDTRRVRDMSGMFRATNYNQPLPTTVDGWTTARVTDMSRMFMDNNTFNQPINSWDTASVTDMSEMFRNASAFNQDLSSWDVSSVTNMSNMFRNATAFDQDISSWDVSNVTDMTDMFKGAGLSLANYDALLIAWAALPGLQSNVTFDAGSSKYCAGSAARDTLISTYGWTITDGGEDAAACADILTVTLPPNAASPEATGGNLPTLLLNGTSTTGTTITFSAGGTATAGSDYTLPATTITIPAGSYTNATQTLNLSITEDSLVEPDETIILTLTATTGSAVIGSPSTHTYTIENDDSLPPEPDDTDDDVSSDSSGGSATRVRGGRRTGNTPATTNSTTSSDTHQPQLDTIDQTITADSNTITDTKTDKEINDLITFLNTFEAANLAVDGSYDADDIAAVKAYQMKYAPAVLSVWNLTEPTGIVGITTRFHMNARMKGLQTKCPVYVEYNALTHRPGLNIITVSQEIANFQTVLKELGFMHTPATGVFNQATHDALKAFQATFHEVILDPWEIAEPTGFKYKTTNKFLNYISGCDTGPVLLDEQGWYHNYSLPQEVIEGWQW